MLFDPLVDPGNPPHRHQNGPAANPARVHHRLVNMEGAHQAAARHAHLKAKMQL
jgi:hypothetical protein